jgi:succinylarginine dihydrolase
MLHRATEADTTERVLRAIFHNDTHFDVHQALPQVAMFGDEGAANHNRLGGDYGEPGLQLFIYGREEGATLSQPVILPVRRWRQARRLRA